MLFMSVNITIKIIKTSMVFFHANVHFTFIMPFEKKYFASFTYSDALCVNIHLHNNANDATNRQSHVVIIYFDKID